MLPDLEPLHEVIPIFILLRCSLLEGFFREQSLISFAFLLLFPDLPLGSCFSFLESAQKSGSQFLVDRMMPKMSSYLLDSSRLFDSTFSFESNLSLRLVIHLFLDLGLGQSIYDHIFTSRNVDCN